MSNISKEARIGILISVIGISMAALCALLPWLAPFQPVGESPLAGFFSTSSVTPSNPPQTPTYSPVIATGQAIAPTPTLFPTHIPVPAFVSDYVTIQFTGTRSISLSEGELIVGDADRFQGTTGEPPCTAFLIKGPYKGELLIYWGGWDQWENVYDDAFAEQLLAVKIEKFKTHPTCPSRGPINVVRLP